MGNTKIVEQLIYLILKVKTPATNEQLLSFIHNPRKLCILISHWNSCEGVCLYAGFRQLVGKEPTSPMQQCYSGKQSSLKNPQSFKVWDINSQGPVLKWWSGCRAWEKCLCAGCTCRTLHADVHAEGKQGVSHAAICRLCTSKHPLPCRNAGLEGHNIHVPAVKNWNDEPHTMRHPQYEDSAFTPRPIIPATKIWHR